MTPPVHQGHRAAGRSSNITRQPIRPERVRRIEGGFAFVPHRFLRDGFYASLTPDEAALYLLLVFAGDRNGVSFYHYDSLCALLQIDPERYVDARDELIELDLLAFDGTRFQVLSLPNQPVLRTRSPRDDHDASKRHEIRRQIRAALQRPSHDDDLG